MSNFERSVFMKSIEAQKLAEIGLVPAPGSCPVESLVDHYRQQLKQIGDQLDCFEKEWQRLNDPGPD